MKICKLVVENLGFYTFTLSTSFNLFLPNALSKIGFLRQSKHSMLKFIIFIIVIQINLFASSNIKENLITFDKTFNLYYSQNICENLISNYTVTIISKISKKSTLEKSTIYFSKLAIQCLWNLENDWHLTY